LNIVHESALVGGSADDETGSPLPRSEFGLKPTADAILLGGGWVV